MHTARSDAKLRRMATTFTSILLHTVFSTKNRVHLIAHEIEGRLHRYMAGIVSNHQCRQLCVGGTTNHVHMLLSMSKNITIADLLEDVKKDSSKWAKRQGLAHRDFYWQEGYSAFSIGQSNVAAVKTYIANQKEHHKKMTFEEELVKLLKRYNISPTTRGTSSADRSTTPFGVVKWGVRLPGAALRSAPGYCSPRPSACNARVEGNPPKSAWNVETAE